MKILFVNSFDDMAHGGGAEVTLWTLMRALMTAGHQCVLLSTARQPGLRASERDGVRIWRAGIRNTYWHGDRKQHAGWKRRMWHLIDAFNPLMQEPFEEVVAAERPDIVSLHNLAGWSSAVLASIRRLKLPAIQVLHDLYALCPKSSMYKQGKNCLAPCAECRVLRFPHARVSDAVTAVVGVSKFILESHLRVGRFNAAAIQRVILNARSRDMVGSTAMQQATTGLRVGFIGRLDPAKGVENLIAAFCDSGLSNAELLIAGAGESDYVASLHEIATGGAITFLGRTIPADFYSKVDIVVVPSRWNEPLGMVVVEAMAHGRPVIGARRGGVPELIEDGVNGLLFDPEDVAELASLLRELAHDAGRLSVLGARAFESSRPFLDTDAWASRYLNLYDEVLSLHEERFAEEVRTSK